MFYVYIHKTPEGIPFYVGKGSGNRGYRFVGAMRSEKHRGIVAKYGEDNILVAVTPCTSEIEAFDLEKQMIAQLRASQVVLCNVSAGGTGSAGCVVSEETRAKMSASHTGMKRSPEAVEKTRKAHTGMKRPAASVDRMREAKKSPSDETRERLRRAAQSRGPEWFENQKRARDQRGPQEVSVDTREKLSAAWWRKSDEERALIKGKMSRARMGRKASAETVAKQKTLTISDATRSQISTALKGRVLSAEWREKLSAAWWRKSDEERAEVKRKAKEAKAKSRVAAISRMQMGGQGAGPVPVVAGFNNRDPRFS